MSTASAHDPSWGDRPRPEPVPRLAEPSPASAELPPETDVLIVGAGPTGLMLANWLQRLGIDHVVIDNKHGPTRESRAIAVQARSLEIYAQLGLIDAVRNASISAKHVRPGWLRRLAPLAVPVGRLGIGQTPYPGVHTLEQSANERLLLEHLEAAGGGVAWGTELFGLEAGADWVTARVGRAPADGDGGDDAGGGRMLRARWCVGADGASSPVRKAAGIDFAGTTRPDTFWVVDGHDVRGLRAESITVRVGPSAFLITFPLPGTRRHRLIGVVRGQPDEAAARRIAGDRFGVTWGESGWFATYRLHSRVAEHFRDGRILLAGDAAHVHSPVGGQGMNTGLQDAHNLAFKLAAVLGGRADGRLLDRYEAERRPVAEHLVEVSDEAFNVATSSDRRMRMMRRVAVPLLAPVIPVVARTPLGHRMVGIVGQWRIHYWMSDAAKRRARGRRDRVVGRRLPWTGSNHDVLRTATWQVHAYAPVGPALNGLPPLVAEAHRFDPRPDLGLRPEYWYLVRPDGFVAAAARPAQAAREFARVLREHGFANDAAAPA
ncbi:MAG: FAD-dependent monooxygenase, partial [Pseudoclavibacter sp.]